MRKYESFDIPPDIMKLRVVRKGYKANCNDGRFVALANAGDVGISSPFDYRSLRFFRYDVNNAWSIINISDLSQDKIRDVYDSEKIQAKNHYRAALCEQNQAKALSAISASFGVAAVTFVGVAIPKISPSIHQQFCEAAKAQTMIQVGCTQANTIPQNHDLQVDASLNILGAILLGAAGLGTLKVKDNLVRNAKINFIKAALALGNTELCKKFMTVKSDLNEPTQEPS